MKYFIDENIINFVFILLVCNKNKIIKVKIKKKLKESMLLILFYILGLSKLEKILLGHNITRM